MSRGPRTGLAIAICAAAYLYAFPYQARINNPNENARFYMTAAIAEEGTYVLDAIRARWGWVNDCAIYEGRAYSVKAPATSFLGVPPYAVYFWTTRWLDLPFDRTVALWLCRVFASILPWLAFLWAFHRWLDRRAKSAVVRDTVFFSVAIGSCLYGYGMLFMSHTLSAASAFGAFMLLRDARIARRIRSGRAFFAGLLTAGVTLLEYPGFVASALLALYACAALRALRRFVPFTVGALIPTLAMMHFQWKCFGSPFSPGHLYVESDQFRAQHHEGFFGAVGLQWDAVYGLLIDPGAGMFPLTPILAFAAVGFVKLARDHRERSDAAFVAVLFALMTASIAVMNNWRGGWTIGPRYLVLMYPFVAWIALEGLRAVHARAPRSASAIAVGALLAALVLSGVPSAYYPHYPPEIDRPVTQVALLLIRHDYAPYAALNAVDVYGTASMVPLALLACAAIAFGLRGMRLATRSLALLLGAVVACALCAPLLLDPRPGHEAVRAATGLITRTWEPAGHDRAARLERSLRGRPDADRLRRLAQLYDDEGRASEAEAARRRARAALRAAR